MKQCEQEGCTRCAARSYRHCRAHVRRRHKQQPMEPPIRERYASPLARLEAAALAYAEADSEDDESWRKARERLRSAGRRLASVPIPTPPDTHSRLLNATADFLSGLPVPPPVEVLGGEDTPEGEEAPAPAPRRRRA